MFQKKIKFIFFSFLILHSSLLISSTLHLSISANPSRLNPIIATDSTSHEISSWLFSSLVKYNKDGKVTQHLAKNYKFIDDTTLEFELKQGILWSDGEELTAQDIIFTYKTITSPKIFTPYSSDFRYVKSVEAIGKYKILVKYKEPYFKALEIWMMDILPSHILKNDKDLMTSDFNKHPIGSGSYTIKGFSPSNDIKLFANPKYFEHKANIDKIIYHFIPDPSTEFLTLKTKKLDMGSLTPMQYERQIDEEFKKHFNIFEKMSQGYTYLGFNLKDKKFQNPKIREALSLAIDRKELVDILFLGHGRVCNGPFMPKTFAYPNDLKPPTLNRKRAKKLLKEAGFDKNHPFNFELITNSNNSNRVYTAQIIQHQLKKIGVNVKIRVMEWQAFLNTVVMPRKFQTVLLGWGLGLMPDAYSIWHSDGDKKGGFNFVGYKNKEVDDLIKKGEKTVNKKELGKIYRKIFKLIRNDNPYLFLFIPNSITVVNKKIKNISNSIIGIRHNTIDWIKE